MLNTKINLDLSFVRFIFGVLINTGIDTVRNLFFYLIYTIMTMQILLSFMAYYGVSVYDDHNAIVWDFNHDMVVNMADLLHLLQM